MSFVEVGSRFFLLHTGNTSVTVNCIIMLIIMKKIKASIKNFELEKIFG